MKGLEEFKYKIFRRKNEPGFSLPEVLVVVLIIAILTVIAIPSVSRAMQLQRLDTYVFTIADKMMDARMYAIKHNRPAWLRIDPTNRTTELQTTNDAGNTINLKTAELLPAGIMITGSTPVEFRFNSLGRLPVENQTITFQTGSSGTLKSKPITV